MAGDAVICQRPIDALLAIYLKRRAVERDHSHIDHDLFACRAGVDDHIALLSPAWRFACASFHCANPPRMKPPSAAATATAAHAALRCVCGSGLAQVRCAGVSAV